MKEHEHQLSMIISLLSKHHQRASYGAVGKLVGLPARSVMSGQAKSAENSWVVAVKTNKPTGYLAHEMDPNLENKDSVITSPQDLAAWLRSRSEPSQ
jgi:alkylated DNA nucleotide flippase Atl1